MTPNAAADVDQIPLGATPLANDQAQFLVWAPRAERVDVRLLGPEERLAPLQRLERGYFSTIVDRAPPGTRYLYRLDRRVDRPDPASRYQPDGVHGPSQIVSPEFAWNDQAWRGIALADYVIYELHVGTFTSAGTFAAVIDQLDDLARLGVTAIELMPVAQFPGGRNWGYDGVHPFAVQNTYGGPTELKRLVDACHARGLSVILDVVYNHLGPEGNYFGQFGHYFTDRYRVQWGEAINVDGAHSDEVRRLFVENALYWIGDFHIDALRLDAIHAICDRSASPFLREVAAAVQRRGEDLDRPVLVIAESNLNDPRVIEPASINGLGHDAQWLDDFGRSLQALLTGERTGFYADFGGLDDFAKAYQDGFILDGQFSKYRKRRHGASSRGIEPGRFVVFSQNHDQVGNRREGERLSALASFEDLKLAAAATILSPYIPMLLMGEEYGETAPFCYFISHMDAGLVAAVREGRRRDFASFGWQGEPADPQAVATFERCKLNHAARQTGRPAVLWSYYQELLRLRKTLPALTQAGREESATQTLANGHVLLNRRWRAAEEVCLLLSFADAPVTIRPDIPAGDWLRMFDSSEAHWEGPGACTHETYHAGAKLTLSPRSAVLLGKEI